MTTKRLCVSCRAAAAAILAILLLAGCSGVRVAPIAQGEGTIKRVARHGEVDYFHRWSHTAYVSNKDKQVRGRLSADQSGVLDELGQPDYVRKPFVSQFGEVVAEWVYLQQDRIFQFADGKQVHAQPVTDIERTLIRFGYPKCSYDRLLENGRRRQTLVYRDWLGRNVELFSFMDGVLLPGSQ